MTARASGPMTYSVHAESRVGGQATVHARTSSIPFDGSAQAGELLPGPAELLCAALSACILESVERFSQMLPFRHESASITVTAEREEPPRIVRVSYRLRVVTDEPPARVELLHKNIRKFGTITNTLAAACELRGETEAVAPTSITDLRAERTTAVTPYPELHAYVETLLPTRAAIPEDRRATLDRIAGFVHERRAARQPARLMFICTHNSRRSHMSQIWAATAAAWYGIDGVETYSGGTEATAFNPRAVAAMRRAGFEINEIVSGGANPHYTVKFATDGPALDVFSKTFDADSNPRSEFAAIMNCGEADEACPIVPGATLRISLPYDDPKLTDGTREETKRYDERAQQIAREMYYLFSRVDG